MPETQAISSKILVLGGARSGKSGFAQSQAEAAGRPCVFIATAEPFDDEMRERIALHVRARGPMWRTREAPYDLDAAIREATALGTIVLVDCLTVWLGNLMMRGDDLDASTARLAATVAAAAGSLILVSNEVGMGIVPDNALARRFRDAQGRLNQTMAATCDHVVFVTAGLARILKPAPPIALLPPAGE